MLLDALKNFSWYNEPANVRFVEEGMLVEPEAETDFWSAAHHGFIKDNGHFFYTEKQGNFELLIKWRLVAGETPPQCGLMLRFDSKNWAKIGLLSPQPNLPQIGAVKTENGYSDWSSNQLSEKLDELWCRAVRRGDDFVLYYSLDGANFIQNRMFHLKGIADAVKIGAYCCSPQKTNSECILESIEV